MKNYISNLGLFIYKVLTEFAVIFGGIIGVVYYFISVYTDWLPEAEPLVLPFYSLAILEFSTFHVWYKEKQDKEKLEREIANPVDYELTATVKFINFSALKPTMDVADSDRQHAEGLIAQWDEWQRTLPSALYQDLITKPKQFATREEAVAYLAALEKYQQQVDKFSAEIENCFLVDFFIKNTGRKYDEEITVHVDGESPEEDEKFKFYENVEDVCDIPEKPFISPRLAGSVLAGAKIARRMVWDLHDNTPSKEIWISHAILAKSISVELTDLKAGTGRSLTNGSVVFKTTAKNITVKYWVASKHATQPVEKTLILDFEKAELAFPGVKA